MRGLGGCGPRWPELASSAMSVTGSEPTGTQWRCPGVPIRGSWWVRLWGWCGLDGYWVPGVSRSEPLVGGWLVVWSRRAPAEGP